MSHGKGFIANRGRRGTHRFRAVKEEGIYESSAKNAVQAARYAISIEVSALSSKEKVIRENPASSRVPEYV